MFETLRIKPEDKKAFQELCEKFGRKQVNFFSQMVRYFMNTGYDPMEHEQRTVQKEMSKLRDTLVSFVRTQEKGILKNMMGTVDATHRMVLEIFKESRDNGYGLIEESKNTDSKEKSDGYQFLSEELQQTQITLEKTEKELKRYQEFVSFLEKSGDFRKNSFVLEGSNDLIQDFLDFKATQTA